MNPQQQLRATIERLQSFDIQLALSPGDGAAVGELSLSPTPFTTLQAPITPERARFFTHGPRHLKFFQPRAFFDLPAVDISRCRSAEEVESCLRQAWSGLMARLGAARDRMQARGIETQIAAEGTRLQIALTGESAVHIEVRSEDDVLLPSTGPLRDVSIGAPEHRLFKVPLGVDRTELELTITSEMSKLGRTARRRPGIANPPPLSLEEIETGKNEHRVLVVANQGELRDQLIVQLPNREILPDVPRDPSRAFDAFRRHSYELVLIQAQMSRIDGFELAMRMRELPGVDRLPVVLLEERARDSSQMAAEAAGASAYLSGPFQWDAVITSFAEMLDNAQERRFSRFVARLPASTASNEQPFGDLTETVARGGLTLRTQREVSPGEHERYRILLPAPLGPIDVVGEIVSRVNLPGYASVLAGIRLLRFEGDGEARWIHMIASLAAREAQRAG